MRRWLVPLFHILLLALMGWAIWARLSDEFGKLGDVESLFPVVRPLWLVVAGGLYLVGLLPSALFWHKTLLTLGQDPTWFSTFRAYYIGHLGKYLPGKALVVVLRVALLRPNVPVAHAAMSVLYETLMMMAIGGLVAGGLLLLFWQDHGLLLVLAIGLALGAALPVLPPVFVRLARFARVGRLHPELIDRVEAMTLRSRALGLLGVAGGWVVLGMSLSATLYGLGLSSSPLGQDLPRQIAAVALSVVAGFLSLLPGGLGVREWVLMELLLPVLPDATTALAVALVLRLVWLVSELAISAILYTVGLVLACLRPSGRPPIVPQAD